MRSSEAAVGRVTDVVMGKETFGVEAGGTVLMTRLRP